MENDGKMSVERSLEIISNAIELGRRDVERNAGTPMIMWGGLPALRAALCACSGGLRAQRCGTCFGSPCASWDGSFRS